MKVNIVYQDIERSKYSFQVDNMLFYFSSLFNLERFKRKYLDYIKNEERKVVNKYHYSINMKNYLLVCFYMMIEKRGFKVVVDDVKLEKDKFNLETNFLIYNEL